MSGSSESFAGFETVSRPMWRVRLARELPRWLLMGAAAFGLLASGRMAIAPPRPVDRAAAAPAVAPDRAAEAYAALFARRYLTWSAAEPQASARALEAFGGPGMEADAGLLLPDSGSQHVEWVEVVQSRVPLRGESVYTVAAQTDPGGLQYLTVAVRREADGALSLAGYPAFVGPPATAAASPPARAALVGEPALEAVVRRALGNYLSGSAGELASDLAPGAQVSLPAAPLQALNVERPAWAPGGGAVQVIVQALDGQGVRCTLQYEIDVSREQGRWEVSAIQTEPDDA